MTMHARWLQLEAAVYLLAARFAIRVIPFRWLTRLFERPPRGPGIQGSARAAARQEVRRAIVRTSPRLPGRTMCFPQAVAAQAMLRRRGVGTVIFCGAASARRDGLSVHVWCKDGDIGVTGYPVGRQFTELVRYPAINHEEMR